MSNLIKNTGIVADQWTLVTLPAPAEDTVRKQAGKVVIFKVTGEPAATPEQLANAVIPASGKVLLPLTLWQARKAELTARAANGEIGLWMKSSAPSSSPRSSSSGRSSPVRKRTGMVRVDSDDLSRRHTS